MALSGALIRSFNRCNIPLRSYRSLCTSSITSTYASPAKLTQAQNCETYIEKNERLKRPLSPHMTIYQIQLTSLLSVTHRTTGIILASYAATLGIGTLVIPGGIGCLIGAIESWCLPAAVLYLGKYFFALPATFHFFNGIRHLLWDLGKFLTMKEVYSTGYAVVAASIISAIILAAM